jgi:magnesium-transporting ATPase (P-type)
MKRKFLYFISNLTIKFRMGVLYEGEYKDKTSRTLMRPIKFLDKKRTFEVLQILDFDSDRKRMSVIVRDVETNEYLVYCKGAENAILEMASLKGNAQLANKNVDEFAEQGLRTLVFSYKQISQSEYNSYNQSIIAAYNDIENRVEKMAQVINNIETNLTLIGTTAVEDKLQDKVPETIENLRKAGIKVWVLTGDKKKV